MSFVLLRILIVLRFAHAAVARGQSKCEKKFLCADGSHPACFDGSQPNRSSRPPTCTGGDEPLCQDGSKPLEQARGGNGGGKLRGHDEDNCKEGTNVTTIVLFSVGGVILMFSLCTCTYCFLESARRNKTESSSGAVAGAVVSAYPGMEPSNNGGVVIGQPVPMYAMTNLVALQRHGVV